MLLLWVRFYYTKSGMGLWGKGREWWVGVGVVLRYTFTMLPLPVKDAFRPSNFGHGR